VSALLRSRIPATARALGAHTHWGAAPPLPYEAAPSPDRHLENATFVADAHPGIALVGTEDPSSPAGHDELSIRDAGSRGMSASK